MRKFLLMGLFSAIFISSNLDAKTYFIAQRGNGNESGDSYANRMSLDTHNSGSFSAGDIIYLCDTTNIHGSATKQWTCK